MADTNRPLWKVLFNARCSTMDDENIVSEARACAAAELRAIAEAIALRFEEHEPASTINTWLEEEADRAEAGE
jgi:hypothetical protein